ncbi:MAG: SDR family NAD(P)-dependent oxidoreductase [Novosphingobium sp.]|nr:SDR family NAD(P)-dependent oxidoreductase [Novosphingobium sp.]
MDRFPKTFLGRLKGRCAIVTGAGAKGDGFGTGRAMAVLFAGEGAKVCVVDRDREAAEATLRFIEQVGGEAFVATGDVTDESDCARFVAESAERFGSPDILVNNVGIAGGMAQLEDLAMADWDHVFDTNLKSAVQMAKAAVPAMRGGGSGAILNIVSIAGMLGYGALAYGASKAAMIQLTRDLAVAHGSDGIRVNAIAPGHIYTPMVSGMLPPDQREARRKAGPLGVEGDAWDIAHAALFLMSEEARFITGTCLPVDGGVTITGSTTAAEMISAED